MLGITPLQVIDFSIYAHICKRDIAASYQALFGIVFFKIGFEMSNITGHLQIILNTIQVQLSRKCTSDHESAGMI